MAWTDCVRHYKQGPGTGGAGVSVNEDDRPEGAADPLPPRRTGHDRPQHLLQAGAGADAPTFNVITTATPQQKRALDLLQQIRS